MNYCVVYHWWQDKNDAPPICNLRCPIIISIATLRGVNPTIPIYVLNVNNTNVNWGDLPNQLNFNVIPINANFQDHKEIPGWKELSRITDVRFGLRKTNIHHDTVIYCDCDVFWIRDPLPLQRNTGFCIDGYNTGFFYYKIFDVFEFFEVFEAYTLTAIYSPEIRKLLQQYVNYDSWLGVWDEMIITYMVKNHPQFFNIIPKEEHGVARRLVNTDMSSMKMFHANGVLVSNRIAKNPGERHHSRGLLGLVIKEFYDNLVLSGMNLGQIYTNAELDLYLPKQFSLLSQVDCLLKTKVDDGHYVMDKYFYPEEVII